MVLGEEESVLIREMSCILLCVHIHLILYSVACFLERSILVGFQQTMWTVPEHVPSTAVCIKVFICPLDSDFIVTVFSIQDHTATAFGKIIYTVIVTHSLQYKRICLFDAVRCLTSCTVYLCTSDSAQC